MLVYGQHPSTPQGGRKLKEGEMKMKKTWLSLVLVIVAIIAMVPAYAADRVAAPAMEPATVNVTPVIDREAAIKAGIDSTIDVSVVTLVSNVPPMMSEDIAGKWGLVSVVTLAGVPKNLFLRPITPCRIVDTRVDGGPFVNGEVRKYLLPEGVRCTTAIPPSVTYPTADGVVVLLEVNFEATNYPWSWGDNGPTLDFIGTAYSPDWFTMHGERAFLFALNEGEFPETAVGKIRGFVTLKTLTGGFVRPLYGLEAKVASQWSSADFRAHVTIDIVGYATPTFIR